MGGYTSKCEKKSKSLHPTAQAHAADPLSLRNEEKRGKDESTMNIEEKYSHDVLLYILLQGTKDCTIVLDFGFPRATALSFCVNLITVHK